MKSSFSAKTTRIIGGQVAPSPIPWQAHLYVDNISRCAAVIIDEETVLTAALAIMENPKSTPPVLFDISSLKIEVGVVSQVRFSSCQWNLIKTLQIEGMIALVTKMTLIFSSDLLNGQK